jgi:hypothetical protein
MGSFFLGSPLFFGIPFWRKSEPQRVDDGKEILDRRIRALFKHAVQIGPGHFGLFGNLLHSLPGADYIADGNEDLILVSVAKSGPKVFNGFLGIFQFIGQVRFNGSAFSHLSNPPRGKVSLF